ncbi:hypothetical protein ANANG_G00052830 [Anguilla anguilla]|uniref:Uncharacterized protein n=1 Tax=Anguilla anguilla TaxID=7936 RepID=A0A9D3S4A0_ANGAN|nr:hypothetical protein ANANG_G00052830 [Anguilla anguilla]
MVELCLLYFSNMLCFSLFLGSASVLISVVIVLLLLFIIVGLLLFYYKKCYKKRQNEMDTDVQSEERQQLLSADPENAEDTPVKVRDRIKQYETMTSPGKTHDEHQKTALTEQHKGTDESAGISQEESQTESLNQGEDSEERGVETEGGNSKHPSSGTVPSSAPEFPPATPPKTENEEETIHPPESSPSPPHPLILPHPAPAPVQNQDQEVETERAAEAESTDETAANQRAGAQRQREEGEGQDGGSDGGGAQPSGAGGGGAENPTADPAQELPSSPEEEEDILRRGPDTDGGAAQCSEAGGGGDESVPKPDSDQDINPRSAEENLSVPPTEPLSTADPAQGLPDTTARSPPHTGASEESCCAEESPTSGPNLEPNSTSEAEEEKKRGREERKDSQDRGVKSPPVKPPKPLHPLQFLKNPLTPYNP